MEDVLEVCQRPLDPRRPVICMDETSKQLVAETRIPVPIRPGQARRIDYEYERKGTADVFMFTETLRGWRWAPVTERRTRIDWAMKVRDLVDVHYPEVLRILLVMDNLNTHSIASLYEAFQPDEARRLAKKLEIHFTPKPGSWLNVAEIELKALTIQCMNRRIPTIEILRREVAVWERDRNRKVVGVDWQFTNAKGRIKLKRLHPVIQC
jgi:hypothetical protein